MRSGASEEGADWSCEGLLEAVEVAQEGAVMGGWRWLTWRASLEFDAGSGSGRRSTAGIHFIQPRRRSEVTTTFLYLCDASTAIACNQLNTPHFCLFGFFTD